MPGLPDPCCASRESHAYKPVAGAPLAGVADQPNDPPMNEQATPSFGSSSGLMLTATYLVMGKLGLMLAIQPGEASGIFPSVGLATAATYLWGDSTFMWILLCSLTLNLLVTAVL